jgi:hypothetical protein
MANICHEYYRRLYTARPDSTGGKEAKDLALGFTRDRLSREAKTRLQSPLSLGKLKQAMDAMKVGKSLGPNGIVIEFYKEYWSPIGQDMVESSIQASRFPRGVTAGAIALLHKGSVRSKLTNWRPITRLNISYKIYAKALQLRLQPVLMEVINLDQSAFLPLRVILDNILLTQEMMSWAKQSRQSLLFLKLDFSKAYDMVE